MKPTILLIAGILLTSPAGSASTVLIDTATRNGGFETNTNSSYTDMDHWFNNPGVQTTAVRSNLPQTGSWAGIVSLASNPTIDTSHILAAGDAFTLSFGYRDNSASGDPMLHWQLFYFSDEDEPGFTPFGNDNRVVLSTDSVTATSTSYVTATFTPAAVSGGDPGIGSTVYLRFFRTTGDGQFPVIDNVSLTVVPEPRTIMIGLMGFLALMRRRRR